MAFAFMEFPFESPALRALVRPAWGQSYDASIADLPGLIVPDAHVEIVLQSGAPCAMLRDGVEQAAPRAMVFAMRHGAVRLAPKGANTIVGLRLSPVVASLVLRTNLADWWDRPAPLSDIVGADADPLLDAIAAAPLPGAGAILEAWLLARLADWDGDHARQLRLQAALMWEVTDQPLAHLLESFGCTARTLRRRCEASAGLSPKQLALSGRMLRAVALLKHERLSIAHTADRMGFGDQAAFTNAFRRYVGFTPGQVQDEPLVLFETRH